MRTAYRLSTAIGNLSWVEVVICHSNPMAPDCRCLDVFCIVWGYDTLVHSLFSDTFIWFYMVSRLLWILLYIVMNYRLLLAFQSFDFELPDEGYFELPDEGYFERTWWRLFWAYLMKVILSVPDEGYSERTWWRLFWTYLMKVILSVPDEGYSERTWWRLFQKRVVCTKLHIYVFIIGAFSLVLKMIDIKLTRNKHLRIDMANIISRIGSSISKLYVLIGCLNAFISHF